MADLVHLKANEAGLGPIEWWIWMMNICIYYCYDNAHNESKYFAIKFGDFKIHGKYWFQYFVTILK